MNVLEKLYIIVGIILGIGLILCIITGIYYLIKTVYLDIKAAKDYREYLIKIFKEKYEEDIKKVKDDYDRLLKLKSEEYFRKFYEEEKRKRLEVNQNGN